MNAAAIKRNSTELMAMAVGFIVLANGATIITVLIAAFQLSSEFGMLKERINQTEKRVVINEKRIYEMEKRDL